MRNCLLLRSLTLFIVVSLTTVILAQKLYTVQGNIPQVKILIDGKLDIVSKGEVISENAIIKCNKNFILLDNEKNIRIICAPSLEPTRLGDIVKKGYTKSRQDGNKVIYRRSLETETPDAFEDNHLLHNFHYLLVDVRSFDDMSWQPLENSKTDIETLCNALNGMLEEPDNKYRIKIHYVLDNKENTRSDSIRYRLNDIVNNVKENNSEYVLLYFASHGQKNVGDQFKLITSDSHIDTLNNNISNCITANELNLYVKQLTRKGAKVLVFVDACKAGALVDGLSESDISESAYFYSTKSDLNAGLFKNGSPFADAVIRALSGREQEYFKPYNNIVAPEQLGDYIANHVKAIVPAQDEEESNAQKPGFNRYGIKWNQRLWEIKPIGLIPDMWEQVNKGDTKAMVRLGDIYYWGALTENVSIDYEKACALYRQAYEKGNSNAGCKLGICYYYGNGVEEQNYYSSFMLFEESAAKGDNLAKYYLSVCYAKGYGVDKNEEKAKEIFAQISKLENIDILRAYKQEGISYRTQYINRENPDFIIIPSQERYGEIYKDEGVSYYGIKSHKKIKKYEKKRNQAIAHWLDKAKFSVYICDENGDKYICEELHDIDYARYLIDNEISFEDSDPEEQISIGDQYIEGIMNEKGIIESNYSKAAYWFNKAARQGSAEGLYKMGLCFEKGLGVERNYSKAAELYLKAAEKGWMSAYVNMGFLYYYGGEEFPSNEREAASCWKLAAEKGNHSAQYNYALCYLDEIGVVQDSKTAVKWLKKSANYVDIVTEVDNHIVLQRFEGFAPAQFILGMCYYYGDGIKQNDKKAFEWFDRAAKQGNIDAQQMLNNHFDIDGKVIKR